MRKPRRYKNKYLTDKDIELYCQSVEDVLARINDRVMKKSKKKQKKSLTWSW